MCENNQFLGLNNICHKNIHGYIFHTCDNNNTSKFISIANINLFHKGEHNFKYDDYGENNFAISFWV